MIKLSHLSPFAEGRTRRCYIHPDNSDLCLKVVIPGMGAEVKQKKKLHRRLFPSSFYDPNFNEWRGYCRAEKAGNLALMRHIPRYYGFSETDLGKALTVQLLRHPNGVIGTPLIERLSQGFDDSLRQAFTELKNTILDTGCYTTDVNNLISIRLEGGDERLFFAECKYRRPGMTIFPPLRRRRMRRILTRLERSLVKYLPIDEVDSSLKND